MEPRETPLLGFWDRPQAELLGLLRTTPAGLTSDEAKRRLRLHGPNSFVRKQRFAALLGFLRFFANPLVIILLVASTVSLSLGDRVGGLIIIAMVLLSVLLNFFMEFQARHAVEEIQKQVATMAAVLRDGREQRPADRRAGSRRRRPAERRRPGAGRRPLAGREGPACARVRAHRRVRARREIREGSPGGKAPDRRRDQQRLFGHRRSDRNGQCGHRVHGERYRFRRDRRAPGRAAAGDRVRPRHTPLRSDDHAGHHPPRPLRPAGQHRASSTPAWSRSSSPSRWPSG